MNRQEWANIIFDWHLNWPQEDIVTEALSVPFFVNKHVFPLLHETAFYTQANIDVIKKFDGNASMLEMGCGCGVMGILCNMETGINVTLADINPWAVRCAQQNVKLHNLNIPVYLSDVYTKLPQNLKFDVISWNIPFNKTIPQNNCFDESFLPWRAGFDIQYKALQKFISEAKNHLTNRGVMILGADSVICDLAFIEFLTKKSDFDFQIISEKEIPFTKKQP